MRLHLADMSSDIIKRLQGRVEQQLQGGVAAGEGWPEVQGEIGELVAILRDVTLVHEKQTHSQQLMVAQLRSILDHASVGIAITRSSCFELLGRHACAMYGYTEDELLGRSTRIIHQSDESFAEFGARVRNAFRDQGHYDGEQLMRRKDGSEFWTHMLARGVVPGDPAGGTIWIMEDITDARLMRDRLSWSATHDSLTQLVNRREFESRLAQAMTPFNGRRLCVMFIDLDRFKAVNDIGGHATGDEVLRQVSRLLESKVRTSDTVCRLGGDEFAVLLPGCSLTRAQEVAEQIRSAVEVWRLFQDGKEYSVGASIGVTAVTPDLTTLESVLRAADSACYEAKNRGRNCVASYQPPRLAA